MCNFLEDEGPLRCLRQPAPGLSGLFVQSGNTLRARADPLKAKRSLGVLTFRLIQMVPVTSFVVAGDCEDWVYLLCVRGERSAGAQRLSEGCQRAE